jgi:indole-3-glycerol phosphate synthase
MTVQMLKQIVQHKRAELARRGVTLGNEGMPSGTANLPPVRSLADAIRETSNVALIAEIKRRSPSRGWLAEDLLAEETARQYQQAGAHAISVLTETQFFGGSNADLQCAKRCSHRPVLRKDFIIAERQIWESRLIGADAILLIAAILQSGELSRLYTTACAAGLEVLFEVHTAQEIEVALTVGAEIIGINNRDLRTFQVNLQTSERLRPLIPDHILCVSESGVARRDDIQRLGDCGINAVLVGEAIVTSSNPQRKIRELLDTDGNQD